MPSAHPIRYRKPAATVRMIARLLAALAWLLFLGPQAVMAGELTKAALQQYFAAPLIVGDIDPALKIWPIFKPVDTAATGAKEPSPIVLPGRRPNSQLGQVAPEASKAEVSKEAARELTLDPGKRAESEAAKAQEKDSSGADIPNTWATLRRPVAAKVELLGYAFEAIDIAPVPGYSGKLFNMLVVIDPKGHFVDVRLIKHQEPIFHDERGDQLLDNFAIQYRGLSIKQTIRIIGEAQSGSRVSEAPPPGVAMLRGISRGTVTVELMDKSIMQSAIKIAAKKFGIVGSVDPEKLAKLRPDVVPNSWDELVKSGLIQSVQFKHQDIEKPFIGTAVAGQDAQAVPLADQPAIELQVALLSLPQVGRNLLDEAGYKKVEFNLSRGLHTLLISSRGRYSFIGDDYVLAGGLNRLALRQGESDFELKDFIYDHGLTLPPGWDRANSRIVNIAGYTHIDPARPLEFRYKVKRSFGNFNKQTVEGLYPFTVQIPAAYILPAPAEVPAWTNVWKDQTVSLLILVAGLAVLSLALSRQRWLVAQAHRLKWFRIGFLVFTLGFVGWYGQAQLSVVNVTGLIEALRLGNGLQYLMFDPLSITLWGFVIISLFVWGRGTFCGWLCPFGALQELISKVLALVGFKGWRLHTKTDARLKWIKYLVLGVLVISALTTPEWTGLIAEVEPFKTSISLYFQRSWPYVLWAVACLTLSVLVYRGYCRYICPLGAALALMGVVRVFKWIPRRAECGTPCQTCRHRCEYQAIEPQGKVAYQECFQCLDCVEIHDSDVKCAPLIIEKRRVRKTIPIVFQA